MKGMAAEEILGMDNRALVAVVMPCFNGAKFLREAIDSVLAQTYENVRLIVVNDGSSDNSLEVLHEYGERITVISQENRGLPAARNRAIVSLAADYYFLLDSDDIATPACIEDRLTLAIEHPEAGIVTGVSQVINEHGQLIEGQTASPFTTEQLVPERLVPGCTWGPPSGWLIPRHTFEVTGYFDPLLKVAEDLDFQLRASRRFRIAYCQVPGIYYRVSPGQMTNNVERDYEGARRCRRRNIFYGSSFGPEYSVYLRGMKGTNGFAVDKLHRKHSGWKRYAEFVKFGVRFPATIPEALRRTILDGIRGLGIGWRVSRKRAPSLDKLGKD